MPQCQLLLTLFLTRPSTWEILMDYFLEIWYGWSEKCVFSSTKDKTNILIAWDGALCTWEYGIPFNWLIYSIRFIPKYMYIHPYLDVWWENTAVWIWVPKEKLADYLRDAYILVKYLAFNIHGSDITFHNNFPTCQNYLNYFSTCQKNSKKIIDK